MVRPGVVALVLVALAVPAVAATDLPRRSGMYSQHGAPLSMLDSDVVVRVRGPIVEATITQTFRNDTDRVTEATYIFPLPADAAVSAMEIETGARTIRAAIESREQAQQRYESAVAAGVGAGLLEQERPDVFTQTVSAIPARGTVKVTLRFDTVARYQAGTWELVLPLVVAPRYVPGTASGRPTTGTGRAPDTDRAPDASRVTPAAAPGAGGRTDVKLEFADAVSDVTSPTHELASAGATYSFSDGKTDHDAVVRWRTKAAAQAWVEASDDGGFAAVLVEAKPAAARTTPVRVMLLLDHAATTRGDGEAVQRSFVRALLGALDANDSVALGGGAKTTWGTATALQRELGARWPSSSGPFDLAKVLATVRGDHPVVLVGDGLVADDRAVLAAAAKLAAPVHVIGIGPAPNRGLLAQLAHATGGTLRFAAVGDDLTGLARDVIADAGTQPERLAITWGTLAPSEVVPANLPRLGAGQALLVVAKVKKVQAANARVRGDVFGFVTVQAPKPPDGATSARGSLARRWAKLRLDELVAAGNTKAITDHALRHGLVSPTTAMVAIGDEVVVKGGVKHTISVPVAVPAGMRWQRVKQQTTVETKVTRHDRIAVKADANKSTKPPKPKVADDDAPKHKKKSSEDGERRTVPREPVSTGPRNQPIAPAPVGTGSTSGAGIEREHAPPPRDVELEEDERSEPSSVAAAPDAGDYDDAVYATEVSSATSSRRALRLSLALGAGIARAGGETAPLGSLHGRADYGARVRAGLEGSLWLVDGLHGQGSVLGTLSVRSFEKRLELGAGVGARVTGDAIGPAVGLSLRVMLPRRGLAAYLRYDGALLRSGDVSTGQNAGSFGVEASF